MNSFRSFVLSRDLRFELYGTALICVLAYAFLLWLYPFPNYYADTGAYVRAAQTGEIGIFRPPGYSWFLALAHLITPNPDVLVLLQTGLYFFSTLFLYLTLRFFFRQGARWMWRVFFFIFLLAPVCIYLCNFAISDSLFISLNNLWIASLLWIMGRRKTGAVLLSTFLLLLLLQVRYISLFYPFITVIALFAAYFKESKRKLLLFCLFQAAAFAGVIVFTKWQTEKDIGVNVFSGFSGWQQANNAMHVLPHIDLKPEDIGDTTIRKLHSFILANTPPELYPPKDSVVVTFLWLPDGPLKRYMFHLQGNGKRRYLYYWHQASIPFGKWGNYVIMHHPGTFVRHYMWPNFLFLFRMSNEALFNYPQPSQQIKDWFGCNNCEVKPRYDFLHRFLARTASKSFNVLWVLFVASLVTLCFRSRLSFTPRQYGMMLLVSFFCLAYIILSVYASPIVLRYMLVIRHSLVFIPFLVFIHLYPLRKN
ncbi:MAG TPA: hypothetical protein VGB46_03245 [Flavisolibacter sp.]